MDFNELSPKLQEQLKNCKTKEEFLELLNGEGYALSEDEMSAIAGGRDDCGDYFDCPSAAFRPYIDGCWRSPGD